jgi:protein O-mannosyl-transferase
MPTTAANGRSWLCCGVLVLAGGLCYAGSLGGAFVFDDYPAILENPAVQSLTGSNWLTRSRSLVDLSFAVNYMLGDFRPFGYHVGNVLIHLLAGLTLFGLIRHTLLRPGLAAHFAPYANILALAVSLLWLVHPLNTEAVTYVVQRYEAASALCYLFALYAFCRGVEPGGDHQKWFLAVVISYALGLRCKETILTLPLLLAWYDWAFVAAGGREMLTRRWLYAALVLVTAILGAATIAPTLSGLAQQIADPRADGPPTHLTAVIVAGMSPLSYLLSQPGVILHYLRLAVWPSGLCIDYVWPVASGAGQIVPLLLLMLTLLGTIGWATTRYPRTAFVAGSFFVLLAPTSSIVPIQDLMVEHRMYLPLAALTTLVVLGAYQLIVRFAPRAASTQIGACLLLPVVFVSIVLGTLTMVRNTTYRTEVALWQDTCAKRPENARSHLSLGTALYREGKKRESLRHYEESLRLHGKSTLVHQNIALVLAELGDSTGALEHYRRAVEISPANYRAQLALADRLEAIGELEEACDHYRQAIAVEPENNFAHNLLANALARSGQRDEAAAEETLVEGLIFRSLGRQDLAKKKFQELLRRQPEHALARRLLD